MYSTFPSWPLGLLILNPHFWLRLCTRNWLSISTNPRQSSVTLTWPDRFLYIEIMNANRKLCILWNVGFICHNHRHSFHIYICCLLKCWVNYVCRASVRNGGLIWGAREVRAMTVVLPCHGEVSCAQIRIWDAFPEARYVVHGSSNRLNLVIVNM
jgi:hypothetical protein